MAHNLTTRILSDMGLVVKSQITILVFILDYFQENYDKIFLKIQKNLFWGYLVPYCANFAEIHFPGKKGALSVFKYFNYLLKIKQKIKKNYCPIPEKNAKMADWQTDNGDFIGTSVSRGSYISRKVVFHRLKLLYVWYKKKEILVFISK